MKALVLVLEMLHWCRRMDTWCNWRSSEIRPRLL